MNDAPMLHPDDLDKIIKAAEQKLAMDFDVWAERRGVPLIEGKVEHRFRQLEFEINRELNNLNDRIKSLGTEVYSAPRRNSKPASATVIKAIAKEAIAQLMENQMAKMTKSTMASKAPIKKAVNSPLMAMKVGKRSAPKMAGGIRKSKGK